MVSDVIKLSVDGNCVLFDTVFDLFHKALN